MTLDKKLDALLDHCGIPRESGTKLGMRTVQAFIGPYTMVCGDNVNLADLAAQSRENIKVLIWLTYDMEALYLADIIASFIARIEASLPMTWEEIKKWLEEYGDED